MFYATLCEIIKDGKILLKKASRGVSKGKWNGLGGKIEDNESVIENLIREVKEEAGIIIKNPRYHGKIKFFQGSEDKFFGIVYIFSANYFEGEIRESEEGELRWFSLDEIPFHEMWQDDAIWLPLVLEGKKFLAEFLFDEEMKRILDYRIKLL
ncbi:MAG: 8-oxo-dGTP diphosphatase [Candidatus Aenigmatarchaeota archaeon]